MDRLLFILPALPDYEPYVFNYLKIATENAVEYDVICWNRKGEKVVFSDNYFVYQHPTNDAYSSLVKLKEILGFCQFVKRKIRRRKYRMVFTFTIADSVLLEPFLTRNYKGRFVFDIRDYSPMVKNSFFYRRMDSLLRNSACNVISSEGFKSWLPGQFEYTVCHNVDIGKIRNTTFSQNKDHHKNTIALLTIGSLRDASANQRVIDAFANKTDVTLNFVGDGHALPILKQYCDDRDFENVHFFGRYRKDEECGFVMNNDMMNIVLPHNTNSDSLMTNRFYLSVLFRKPMIVNDGCFQAEQVKKYGLGLVVSDADDLYESLVSYWQNLNWNQYATGCCSFLDDAYEDMIKFRDKIEKIINNKGFN